MARFNHPNAVAYFDGNPNDPAGPILVMEYLRGVDLNVLLQRSGRFTPERTGRLLGAAVRCPAVRPTKRASCTAI